MEEVARNGRLMFDKPSQCLVRVLVLRSQSGCLLGLGGAIIKEMVDSTGARIQILDETNVPACASHYERVLQASIFLEQNHYKLYNLVVLVSALMHSSLSCEDIAASVNLIHVYLSF